MKTSFLLALLFGALQARSTTEKPTFTSMAKGVEAFHNNVAAYTWEQEDFVNKYMEFVREPMEYARAVENIVVYPLLNGGANITELQKIYNQLGAERVTEIRTKVRATVNASSFMKQFMEALHSPDHPVQRRANQFVFALEKKRNVQELYDNLKGELYDLFINVPRNATESRIFLYDTRYPRENETICYLGQDLCAAHSVLNATITGALIPKEFGRMWSIHLASSPCYTLLVQSLITSGIQPYPSAALRKVDENAVREIAENSRVCKTWGATTDPKDFVAAVNQTSIQELYDSVKELYKPLADIPRDPAVSRLELYDKDIPIIGN